MEQYIGCDAHKRYSMLAVMDQQGNRQLTRVNHEPGALQSFLGQFEPGTPAALETAGHW